MAMTEDRVDKLEEKYSNLHTVINVLTREMQDFKEEMRDFKQEMRQQNEMRANEIAETRTAIQSIQASLSSAHSLNIATIVGIAAIAVTVLLK